MSLRPKSIAAKLMFVTGLAITIVLLISNFFLISQTRDRVHSLVMDQADVEARAIANEIAGDVGELASAARSMAGVIGRGHEGQNLDRKGALNILKANVEQNAFAFGSWFCEVEKSFDGQQAELVNNLELGTNANGVFTPYWSKTADGGIQFSTFDNDYSAAWYALAAKSGKGAITEPYLAEGTELPTTMSSIAYPVISSGKMIGVAGVDISLRSMSEKLSALKPFGNGRVFLVAQGGQWLVAPQADLLMKPYADAGTDLVTKALSTGTGGTLNGLSAEDDGKFNRLVHPFAVPGVNTTWAIIIDIPETAVNGPVNAQTQLMILGGLIVLAAVMTALWFAVRSLVQGPLHRVINTVSRLGEGRYADPVEGQDRSDELGLVAKSLDGFRHRLAETRELESETQRQRQAVEDERSRSESDREQSSSLQRRIVASLGAGLSALSSGRLTYRIEDDFPGEYAKLKADFNSAVESLEQTISTVSAAVESITDNSGEISHSTNDLSKRTEQQAASLEETAAALNELTEQVHSSAEHADSAAQTVGSACSDAEKSGAIVNSAVASMHGIEQSSQEISRIIGVIDEIAFQTNLLALNAGVEAARAGEAGKGFAVVAQEVRELAQRSAQAAKEIKSLINASGTQVADGVKLVGQAGDALHRIAEQVMRINGLVGQISASASEQAAGLREINSAVNQMDQVTQQNTAMVEETSAASMVLKTEAERLKALIARFEVRNSGGASALRATANAMRTPPSSARPAPAKAAATQRLATAGNAAIAADWEEF